MSKIKFEATYIDSSGEQKSKSIIVPDESGDVGRAIEFAKVEIGLSQASRNPTTFEPVLDTKLISLKLIEEQFPST